MNIFFKNPPDIVEWVEEKSIGFKSVKETKSYEGKLCVQSYPKYFASILSFLSHP